MSDLVRYALEGNIAVLTVDNPPVNALGIAVRKGLKEGIERAISDPDAEAIALICDGRTFFAGADISEFGKPPVSPILREVHEIMEDCPKPIVAGIHGTALGGGLETALACHYRIAVPSAKLGLPEVNLGILPGAGGTQRLPRLIGTNMAKEMIFTGKMISSAEALQIGLANKVVPQDQLLEEVLKTAKEIAAKGRVALREAKQAVNRGMDVDLITGCSIEIDAFAVSFASPDAKEGTTAFVEKRKAEFKGSLAK